MQRTQHIDAARDSRHDYARCGWHTSAIVATSFVGVVVMPVTLATAKINPRRTPGGLPEEGNP
jgi:hypothetical protein